MTKIQTGSALLTEKCNFMVYLTASEFYHITVTKFCTLPYSVWHSVDMFLSFCQQKTSCARGPFVTVGLQHFELSGNGWSQQTALRPRLMQMSITDVIKRNKVFFYFLTLVFLISGLMNCQYPTLNFPLELYRLFHWQTCAVIPPPTTPTSYSNASVQQ